MALHNYIYSKYKDTDFAVSKIARDHDPRPMSIHPLELENDNVDVNVNEHHLDLDHEQEHEKLNNIINNNEESKESNINIDQLNLLNNSHIKYNHDEFEDVTSDTDYCDSVSSNSNSSLSTETHNLNYKNQNNINGNKNDNEGTSVGNIASNLDKLNCDNKTRWVVKEGKLRKLKSRFDNNKKDKKRRKVKKNEKHISNFEGDTNNNAEDDSCSQTLIDNVINVEKQVEILNMKSGGGSIEVEA